MLRRTVVSCRYLSISTRTRCWASPCHKRTCAAITSRPERGPLVARRWQSTGSSSFPSIGDTIYALSTAQGRAGIAVIRISGPSCLGVRVNMTGFRPQVATLTVSRYIKHSAPTRHRLNQGMQPFARSWTHPARNQMSLTPKLSFFTSLRPRQSQAKTCLSCMSMVALPQSRQF